MGAAERVSGPLASPAELAGWMNGLPGTVAEPRSVTIDGTDRSAAWFSQLRELPVGSPARREALAERRSPTYAHEGIYVLGSLPLAYRRSLRARTRGQDDVRVLFQDQQGQCWFIAGFADERAAFEHAQYHPFGPWFLLQRAQEWMGADEREQVSVGTP